jgi:hypothetical protein
MHPAAGGNQPLGKLFDQELVSRIAVCLQHAAEAGKQFSRPRAAARGLQVINQIAVLGIACIAEQIAQRRLARLFPQVADGRFIRLDDKAFQNLFAQQRGQRLQSQRRAG